MNVGSVGGYQQNFGMIQVPNNAIISRVGWRRMPVEIGKTHAGKRIKLVPTPNNSESEEFALSLINHHSAVKNWENKSRNKGLKEIPEAQIIPDEEGKQLIKQYSPTAKIEFIYHTGVIK